MLTLSVIVHSIAFLEVQEGLFSEKPPPASSSLKVVAFFAAGVKAREHAGDGRAPELAEHGLILRGAAAFAQHLAGGGVGMDSVKHEHTAVVVEAAFLQGAAAAQEGAYRDLVGSLNISVEEMKRMLRDCLPR